MSAISSQGKPLDWNHPKFFPCKCPKCGWRGMSDETAGGSAIADTGDFDDPVCPQCIAPNGNYENGKWIPVEEIPQPNNPMKTFKSHPYIWTLITIALTWLPLAIQKTQAVEFPLLAFGVPIMMNYTGRKCFPLSQTDAFGPTFEKHFNSILIGTILCSFIVVLSISFGFKWAALIALVPFLWQGISLPTGTLMLPHIQREYDAIRNPEGTPEAGK